MAVAGPAHAEVAARVRQAIERGATLEGRSSPYRRVPGRSVSREETLRVCAEILRSAYDDLAEAAFYFVAGINDVLEKARTV